MKMIKAFLLAAVTVVALCAEADTWIDPETGITWTYKVSSGKASIEGLDNRPAVAEITIPSILGGYPVTCIGEEMFWGYTSLESVTIPDSVTRIERYAFSGCSSLKSVMIPDSVTSIAYSAFRFCHSLESVTIPDSVTRIESYAFYYCSSLKSVTIPDSVTCIGDYAFAGCSSLTSVTIPNSVTSIGDYAFSGCSSLMSVMISDSVTSIRYRAFDGCSLLENVFFKGAVPSGVTDSKILDNAKIVNYSRDYGLQWSNFLGSREFQGFTQPNRPVVEYVSVRVRENDPTILDCVYRVKSGKSTVKVRALAFKDGVRSFAKVVRPETFIEGTAQNIGDAVAANVEHKLSWQVSADWNIDLAKVSFEVLATEDQLLPLELRTIPANGSNKAMEFSWNAITSDQVFTALLWLYADKDAGLKLVDGALFEESSRKMLACDGDCSGGYISNPPKGVKDYLGTSSTVISYSGKDSIRVVFSEMGFSLLSGSNLTYVNTMSRLGLSPIGVLQYAYRWIEK